MIGNSNGLPGANVVRAFSGGQLASNAPVTLNSSGVLDLSVALGAAQTIGSLAGKGPLKLGSNALTVGGNNASTQYDGQITGSGGATVVEQGTGTWSLGGVSDTFPGPIIVNAGTLDVNGWIPLSPVAVKGGGKLMGRGLVGNVTSAGGMVSPGCCPTLMKLNSRDLTLDINSTFRVQLDGTNSAGAVKSSQIAVGGPVKLGGATLMATLGFNSTVGNQFTIIDNKSNDTIGGIFKNLPGGTNFIVGTAQFQITYEGGDGNDVVLTHIANVPPPQLGGITQLGNGQTQITGTGFPGLTYTVEASTDLMAWVSIGTATAASPGGELTF
ncbi:MAG: hypothetical protein L0219_18880, partial [Phycisphaerales bacterium]|nr:hypothetical protein [Phycisphaerales bacterium]